MSTTGTSTYTATSVSTGMPSKAILLLGVLFAILWGALDINYHGHFRDRTIQRITVDFLKRQSHVAAYLDREYFPGDEKHGLDPYGQKELGGVKVVSQGRKIILTGKVDNEDIRKQISDAAAQVPGVAEVDNQLEVLNIPELNELQALLQSEPYKTTMNYQVKGRGTVYLTGDLPNPELKDKITSLVGKIHGVRSVVNDLGKVQEVTRMMRLHNIYFDFNDWHIRPQSQAPLDEVEQAIHEYLAKNPAGKVWIEGHTDQIATDQYNDWLSQKRAAEVVNALVSMGIDRNNLDSKGWGKRRLLAKGDSPEQRAENRRIEVCFGQPCPAPGR